MKNHLIKRSPHDKENPYFMMRTDTAQNKALSYEARGMLAYLLSQPDHWQVKVYDLILDAPEGQTTKAGKAKVYGILDELAEHGYIKKPKRYRGDNGRWQWTPYEVYETPHTDSPDMVGPETVSPDMDEPDTVNRDCKESTESVSTDSESTKENVCVPAAIQEPKPPKIVPIDPDTASYEEWLSTIAKVFQVGTNSALARNYYNMFKGRAKTGKWQEHNITPPATLDEFKAWVTYEKRQHVEKFGDAEFNLRKTDTINGKFLYWRERKEAQQAERERRQELESA